MTKDITLKEVGEMLEHVVKHMATKDDIAEIRNDMARKDQLVTLHTQLSSIETQLRAMKHTKLESRVLDLEEEVFGETRARCSGPIVRQRATRRAPEIGITGALLSRTCAGNARDQLWRFGLMVR